MSNQQLYLALGLPVFAIFMAMLTNIVVIIWQARGIEKRLDDQGKRIDDLRDSVAKRIGDIDAHLSQRLDDQGKRIDDLRDSLGKRIDELRDLFKSEIERLDKRIESLESPLVRH